MPTTGPAMPSALQVRFAGFAGGVGAFQADGVIGGEALDHAGAAQQFQVVEALMARDVARLGYRDGAG